MKAAFIGSAQGVEAIYSGGRRERLATEFDMLSEVLVPSRLCDMRAELKDLQILFATRGMAALSSEQMACLPALEVLFYAAGSVQHFARPFLKAGVKVISAWGANAVPVAEYTVAQILLSGKGILRALRATRSRAAWTRYHFPGYPGNFEITVSLLGAGMIGRAVIERLKPFALNVVVYDPFLSEKQAAELGVEKVGLEEAFTRGLIVSNHLADLPATRGMLTGELFARMVPGATFINTGRGATVNEPAMIRVLTDRPDLSAVLDVTWPEPPDEHSPLYRLDNIFLTPHLAGAFGRENWRMADYMIEEAIALREGRALQFEVSLEMLDTMA